jgi:hypothetical protein
MSVKMAPQFAMNEVRCAYSVVSWNIHGLGHPEKCDAVRDTLSISHPHIICIQESKLENFDSFKCRSVFPPYLSSFAFTPVVGSRGGLITVWSPAVVADGPATHSNYMLFVPFTSTASDHTFLLTNVYAPSDHRDIDPFVADLTNIAPTPRLIGSRSAISTSRGHRTRRTMTTSTMSSLPSSTLPSTP